MWKRWWLFHATDFQSLMYPCFTIGRILGMFPYKINASTFEASKPYYILSTVIICVCCVFNLSLIHDIISNINLERATLAFVAVNYYTCKGFIMIISHVLSGHRMHLLQNILDISSELPPQSYQNLSRFIHVKDVFGTIFYLVVLISFCFFKMGNEIHYMIVLITVSSIYLDMIEFQINMLYINCVCVLKACFKKINENVAHMQQLIVNDIKPYIPTLICHMPRNQILLIKLKTLKKQHLNVSDAVKMLNIIFSLQIILIIVSHFCSFTFEMYVCVVRWQDGLLISVDSNYIGLLLISLTLYIIEITLLVWACETVKNQAQELRTTIHDVLNSTSDEQIKHELQLFSLQILHQKNIFSLKGLTVDATLITKMVANFTTYMLIFVQFLIMTHSCN